MKSYDVECIDNIGNTVVFRCMADDEQHAIEQALNEETNESTVCVYETGTHDEGAW